MKFLKFVLIGIGVLIVLFLLVAAFLPSDITVERSTTISATDTLVYNSLITFRNRASWDPWLSMDPGAKVTLSGPDSGVGATYSWSGETIGSGYMTIKEIVPYRGIKSDLVFGDTNDAVSDIFWEIRPVENGTRVTWRFQSELGWPIERWFGLMFEGMLGPQFETGLSKLKTVIEKN